MKSKWAVVKGQISGCDYKKIAQVVLDGPVWYVDSAGSYMNLNMESNYTECMSMFTHTHAQMSARNNWWNGLNS